MQKPTENFLQAPCFSICCAASTILIWIESTLHTYIQRFSQTIPRVELYLLCIYKSTLTNTCSAEFRAGERRRMYVFICGGVLPGKQTHTHYSPLQATSIFNIFCLCIPSDEKNLNVRYIFCCWYPFLYMVYTYNTYHTSLHEGSNILSST